jgi:hypothetical protein
LSWTISHLMLWAPRYTTATANGTPPCLISAPSDLMHAFLAEWSARLTIGKRIPAATGLKSYRWIEIEPAEPRTAGDV